jgi:DNA gyrase subunit B
MLFVKNFNLPQLKKICKSYKLKITGKNKNISLLKNPLNLFEYINHIIGKIDVQRYKGLGEMTAQQLYDSTVSMQIRILIQVTFEDCLESTKIINDLMTIEGVDSRKRFIVEGMVSEKS